MPSLIGLPSVRSVLTASFSLVLRIVSSIFGILSHRAIEALVIIIIRISNFLTILVFW